VTEPSSWDLGGSLGDGRRVVEKNTPKQYLYGIII